jgi:hypothetical protein
VKVQVFEEFDLKASGFQNIEDTPSDSSSSSDMDLDEWEIL